MKFTRKAEAGRRKRQLYAAVRHYNEAVRSFEAAANELLKIARESGTETVRLTAAVMEVRRLAQCALINTENIDGGDKNGEKQ